MKGLTPSDRVNLLDYCDTLEAICQVNPHITDPSRQLVWMIDQVQSLSMEQHPREVNRYVAELIVRADAMMHSPDLERHPGSVFHETIPEHTEQRLAVNRALADRDLVTLQHVAEKIHKHKDPDMAEPHRIATDMILHQPAESAEEQCKQALGGLKSQLHDLTLGIYTGAPAPEELFDLRYLRIRHSFPEDDAPATITSTISYNGNVLCQLENPAVPDGAGGIKPPVGDLALAYRARSLFYSGDALQGVEPLFRSSDSLLAQVADGLQQTRGVPYVDQGKHQHIERVLDQVSKNLSQTANEPTSAPAQESPSM